MSHLTEGYCWRTPKGRSLCVMHALFTTMATEFDAHTDLMAERLVLLGGVARGTVRTARRTRGCRSILALSWMATPMCGR